MKKIFTLILTGLLLFPALAQDVQLSDIPLRNKKRFNFSTKFSYDGKLLAGGGAGSIVLWDVEKKTKIQEFIHDEDVTFAVAFSPDGYYVAAACPQAIYVFTISNGLVDKRFVGHMDPVISLEFSPDGQYLYSGGADNLISVWDMKKNMKVSELRGHSGPVTGMALDPTGEMLASSSDDKSVIVWDLKTNSKKNTLDLRGGQVKDLDWSPNGEMIAAALEDKSVRMVYAKTMKLGSLLRGHKAGIYKLTYSKDGKYIFSASKDETVICWDALTGDPVIQLKKQLIGAYDVDVNPQGTLLSVAEGDVSDQLMLFQLEPLEIEPIKLKPIFVHKEAGENSYSHPSKTNFDFNKDKPEINIIQPTLANMKAKETLFFDKEIEVRGNVKSTNGIFEFTVNNIEVPTDENGNFTYKVKLAYGHNTVKFKATDIYSNVQRESFTLIRQVKVAGYNDTLDRAGTDYALIIATDEYSSWDNLSNPIFDGTALAKELESRFGFQTEIIKNPTKREIVSTLRSYSKKLFADDDQLLIFIAGHGEFDDIFQEGYVVASDSKEDDEIKETYLSHSNLRTIVNHIPCEHIMLVMDVCFGGTFDPQKYRGRQGTSNHDKRKFIENKMEFTTRRYITSGGKEYVPDGRPGHHSPFTRKFLEALRSDGGDYGVVTYKNIVGVLDQVTPHPTDGEFGKNAPGSDFLFILKE